MYWNEIDSALNKGMLRDALPVLFHLQIYYCSCTLKFPFSNKLEHSGHCKVLQKMWQRQSGFRVSLRNESMAVTSLPSSCHDSRFRSHYYGTWCQECQPTRLAECPNWVFSSKFHVCISSYRGTRCEELISGTPTIKYWGRYCRFL